MSLFKKDLEAFLLKPLRKALAQPEFAHLAHSVEEQGRALVDHVPHLTSHPKDIQQGVENYRAAISGPTVFHRTPKTLQGISPKAVVSLPRHGEPQKRDDFLLKPYHEKLGKGVDFWMQHPILGWAEMTNQALWHAAGIGHMHQGVHVTEHDLGPANPGEPLLAIHMTPGSMFAKEMTAKDYEPGMDADMAKMGLLDYITGNQDRHPENLLVVPPVDESGFPRVSRLLAIDHGRSFQYKASRKALQPWVEKNGQRIKIPVHLLPVPDHTQDSLKLYLGRWGFQAIDRYAPHPVHHPDTFMPVVENWWPGVRNNVVREFEWHLGQIQDEKVRKHLTENFMHRCEILDEIARNPRQFRDPQLDYGDFTHDIIPFGAP